MHQWHVFNEFKQASITAADFIGEQISDVLKTKDTCHVALPGGNTPALCLGYLANKDIPWEKVHWYLSDERCVPEGHKDRNDLMLYKHLWSKVPNSHAHAVPAELGAEDAAEKYNSIISSIDRLDLAFLGMGEDGHTASLFPGNKALSDGRSVVPVYDSPKPPAERVSLSLSTLQNASSRVVLASGEAKAEIISKIKQGVNFPVNSIGDIHWFIDELANTLP